MKIRPLVPPAAALLAAPLVVLLALSPAGTARAQPAGAGSEAAPPAATAEEAAGDAAARRATEADEADAAASAEAIEAAAAARVELECLAPASDDTAFGWTRDRLFGMVCQTGRWIDSGFGDEPFGEAAQEISGYFAPTVERRQGAGLEVKPRFRVRIKLPNLNRRLNLRVERDAEARVVSGEAAEGERPLEQAVAQREDTTTVSLGFEARRALDRLLEFRLGIRASGGKPNPFVRSRYRRDYVQDTDATWRFSQSLFYRHIDGFGETTTLEYERFLSDPWLFRWTNSGTVSQITEGLSWQTAGHLWHALGPGRALQFTLGWSGQTAAEVDLQNYGYRLTYRQALGRPWLIGEIYGGHDFPRTLLATPRVPQAYLGAKIEIHYGKSQP